MIDSRRYDLDWLRVIAFLVLIYFHAAIFFIPGGIPQIQNQEISTGLEVFVDISSQFRLGLLFFISGLGVAFAKRRLSNRDFVLERSKRLLIPLLVGILFIVPPMIYLEKVHLGQFSDSFLVFYPQFFTAGIYPSGNLSWHHLWFLVYLYLYCLIGIKCFAICEQAPIVQSWLRRAEGPAIYQLILPMFITELLLRALFPGFRDLIHDWASFSQWFILFTVGYLIAKHPALLDTALKFRYLSLTLLLVCTLLSFALFGGLNVPLDLDSPYLILNYTIYCLLRVTVAWCGILSCIGFAARHLSFNHKILAFLNQSVYPLFVMHLTILTGLGVWIVELPLPLWPKYLLLTSLTIILTLLLVRHLIMPFNAMRYLFGLKPQPKLKRALAAP